MCRADSKNFVPSGTVLWALRRHVVARCWVGPSSGSTREVTFCLRALALCFELINIQQQPALKEPISLLVTGDTPVCRNYVA